MPHETLAHGTHTFDRRFRASLDRLFTAWSSAEARAAWGSPDPSITLRALATDFRVGGEDVAECVYEGAVVATVRTRWHDITPPRRVVSTETMYGDGQQAQGVTLISAELRAEGTGSRLVLTVQAVGFDGSGLEHEAVGGWAAGLDALEAWLDS